MITTRTLLTSSFAIIALSALVSCAKISTVSTNLDQSNFTHYFSPSEVRIYQNEDEFEGRAKLVSMVEGEHCQLKAHHAEPDEIEARTDARRKAYQLGANAIVFSGCTLVAGENLSATNAEGKQCVATRVCYGKAYVVEANQD